MTEPTPPTSALISRAVVLVHGTDAVHRRQVARALEAQGISTRLSSRASEAAKCVRDGDVQAALLLDDADMLRTLRELHPALRVIWAGPPVHEATTAAAHVMHMTDATTTDAIVHAVEALLR